MWDRGDKGETNILLVVVYETTMIFAGKIAFQKSYLSVTKSPPPLPKLGFCGVYL